MCVNLFQAMSAVEMAGALQAVAHGADAVGNLAAGVTRARMSRADARGERAYGQAKADRIRKAGEAELSGARAAAAASGVAIDSGSVMEAERSIVRNVEQDAMSAILTGNNRAATLEDSARYYQRAGLMAATDSLFQAGSKWKSTRRDARSAFRYDDPYRSRAYVGGGEGE